MAAIEHAEQTNWQGVILSALVPMLVVIGFAYRALVSEGLPDQEGWVVGMFLLIPLEFIRALIISVLADAYKTGRNPLEVVQTFLISVAILLVLCIGYVIFKGGISDGLSLLASPYLYKLIGFPILITVVDGIFGVLSFSGDPKLQAARLQALAEDSIDWLSVALFRLPFLILPAYGLLAWAGSAGSRFAAWVPMPGVDLAFRAALFYLAFYFLGKTFLAAYVQTARFALTRKRLLDVPWMQRVRHLFGDARYAGRDIEKEAAQRYKDSPHSASVLHFEEDVIQSLKSKSSSVTPEKTCGEPQTGDPDHK